MALASVFSVIRNASVPYGITTPGEPNISSTRWRTVADHKRRLYFFESALTPNTFWVDLNKVDFGARSSSWTSARTSAIPCRRCAGPVRTQRTVHLPRRRRLVRAWLEAG